jgi:hypothetical protein
MDHLGETYYAALLSAGCRIHRRSDALLAPDHRWGFDAAYELVSRELIERLPGEPWKGG